MSQQLPSRPGEFHPEPLTDPDLTLSRHPARATARRLPPSVWLLRKRWDIPTVKINGVSTNPMRWPDGSFSIQGAAAALGITTQTVFDYLARGLLAGNQLTKGQPWQIKL